MFRCNHHHQAAHYLSLLKLQLLKQSKHIYVDNSVVWLHMLFGPYQCVHGALFRNQIGLIPNSAPYTH